MTAGSLERRVSEALGFYPSYLSALESTPEAAALVWEESERALVAPWAERRGRWLGGGAAAAIEAHLPATVETRLERVTFDEPPLQDTVEFFSFVLLRLGMGIASCRYALEGESTRRKHRDGVSARELPTPDAPNHWSAGVATEPPVDPHFTLVQPGDASPHVEATYRYLIDALGTPTVNNIFRAFGSDPAFLTAVVDAQVDGGFDDAELVHELRGLYAKALDADADRTSFVTDSISEPDRLAVAESLATFHDNLATLLVTLYIGTRLVGSGRRR